MPRGKFIALNISIRKEERPKIRKTSTNKQPKEIIESRNQQNRKWAKIAIINENKSYFFELINKIHKPLTDQEKKREDKNYFRS